MSAERLRSQPPARAAGSYLLLLRLGGTRALDVGMLGRVRFPAGNYVYAGSAMGGLGARVKRHFRSCKKVKWHIDRLLAVAELSGAVLFPSEHREECRLARAVLAVPGTRPVPGFGSSDCRCIGHLVHLGTLSFGELLGRLDGRGQGAGGRVRWPDGSSTAPLHLAPRTLHPAPRTLPGEALD